MNNVENKESSQHHRNNKVLYNCVSGLGDKLLSILGIYIICITHII